MPDEETFGELTQEQAQRLRGLLLDLIHMDRLAKEQGHSLVDVLTKCARDQFGIDIRPSHDAKEIRHREY